MSGITLSRPLKLEDKPVTRVENICATGSEAFRQAGYAVASGAYDIAMAVGVEKLKDSGFSGLNAFPVPNDGTAAHAHRAPRCSRCSPPPTPRSTASTRTSCKEVLTRIAWKNHNNGARNPRAQFRKEVSMETIARSPTVAGAARRLRLLRRGRRRRPPRSSCRAEDAHRYTDTPLYVKALSFVAGNGCGPDRPDYDYTTFPEVVALRARTPTRRPASPTRAPSSRWPRCTTASRRPSWC